jgi:hypothetical protein
MKTVTITCDVCEKELIGEHIEIGAQGKEYLQFKNTLAHRRKGELISIENHETLHFCSKEHFVKFFFERGSE